MRKFVALLLFPVALFGAAEPIMLDTKNHTFISPLIVDFAGVTVLNLPGSGTVTTFSAGNLSPIFVTNVTNPTTTPALSFTLSNFGGHAFLGNNTGSAAPPTAVQPAFSDLSGSFALTQSPSTGASKLIGRGDSGAGAFQEITLGTNLSITGTTLNATGGGGGNVSSSGTPTSGQLAEWTDATHIRGDTASQSRTAIGATTVGGNLLTLTNPSAITFLKINADNTVTAENAATFRGDIGAGTGDVVGPASSTDFAYPMFNGTTGKLLQNSNMTGDSAGTVYVNHSASIAGDLSSSIEMHSNYGGGAATNNFGTSLDYYIESSTTNDRQAARVGAAWLDATDATRSAYLDFRLVNNAATWASKMRLFPSGGLSVNNTTDPGAGVISANTGFKIGTTEFPIATNGIVKRTAANTYAAAVSGTDYEVPLTFSQSLNRATNTVTLLNDSATPGNSMYYGTDSGGTKGYFTLPAGGGNVSNSGTPTVDQTAVWTDSTHIKGVTTLKGGTLTTQFLKKNSATDYDYSWVRPQISDLNDVSSVKTLIGSNATGTNIVQIALGSGLDMTGSTLNVTSGGGNVSNSGTPTAGQTAVWTDATHIQGVTSLAGGTTGQVLKKNTNTDYDYSWGAAGTGTVTTTGTPASGNLTQFSGATSVTNVHNALAATGYIKVSSDDSFTLETADTHLGSLGAVTVGKSFFTLTNPNAITFPRINADNSVSALSASAFKTALSLTSTDVGLGNVTNDAQTKASIVPNDAPTAGQILIGNGTAYAKQTVSGSGATISLGSTGVLTLSAIPNATLTNSSITIAGTGVSLGGSITQDTITGLASTGIVKRTAANTLGIAVSGTDYEVPLTFSQSLNRVTNTVTLLNDSATPGNSQYYGTNASGTKGYFALPTGGGAPGGLDTQVQYRVNGTTFGGITNATTDGTTMTLTSPKVVTDIKDTNGATILSLAPTASAVDYLTLSNSATGAVGHVIIGAAGSDTGVNIDLAPKSASVHINSTTAVNAPVEILRMYANKSGAPAGANLGPTIIMGADSATVTNREEGGINMRWIDATDATRTSAVQIANVLNGIFHYRLRIWGSGGLTIADDADAYTDPGVGYVDALTGYKINGANIFPVTTARGGVPAGGTINQILQKVSGTDYDVGWTTASGGGNVSNIGTPTADQLPIWTDSTHIKGVTGLTGGSLGQVLKKNSATDYDWTWGSVTAGAAGSDKQVQFNDGGTNLGGDAGLVYDKTLGHLTVTGASTGIAGDTPLVVAGQDKYLAFALNATKAGGTGQAAFSFQKNGTLTFGFGSDFSANGTKDFFIYDATATYGRFYISALGQVQLGSGQVLGWSATPEASQSADLGVYRNASGILEVNNFTPGQFRDILTRGLRSNAVTFANAIASPVDGTLQAFTDSSTNTQGATITGGGSNHVVGYYNGTNWIVTSGAGGGGGNVTTSATLTSNALILGNGGVDTKVSTGLNSDGASQLVLGVQNVNAGTIKLISSSATGDLKLGSNTTTAAQTFIFPNASTDLSITGGTGHVLKQATAGGAITSGTLAAGDVGLGNVTNDAQIKSSDFPASSVDGEIALFNSTSGKSIKRATGSGLVKATSGVYSTVTAPTGDVVGTSDTQTLTSKRINPRTNATTSNTNWTPNSDSYDEEIQTALAGDATINAPSGTPVQGQKLILRITSNASPHNLSFNGTYTAIGVTIPTSIAASKTIYVGCIYNSTLTRWDVVAVATQA